MIDMFLVSLNIKLARSSSSLSFPSVLGDPRCGWKERFKKMTIFFINSCNFLKIF